MELIFRDSKDQEIKGDVDAPKRPEKQHKTKKAVSARKNVPAETKKKPARSGKSGPATVLSQLIQEGFFKANRTLNAIIDYTGKKRAHKSKQTNCLGL